MSVRNKDIRIDHGALYNSFYTGLHALAIGETTSRWPQAVNRCNLGYFRRV